MADPYLHSRSQGIVDTEPSGQVPDENSDGQVALQEINHLLGRGALRGASFDMVDEATRVGLPPVWLATLTIITAHGEITTSGRAPSKQKAKGKAALAAMPQLESRMCLCA